MNHNDKAQALYDRAEQLMRLCRQLDYRAIAAHQPQAVAALQRAIEALRLPGAERAGDELADHPGPAAPPAEPAPPAEDKSAVQARRRRFIEALGRAELGQRVGKLYYSNADSRQIAFREAPHKHGLPAFDLVVSADFSPVEGYHGIFIGSGEVMSCMLPLDGRSWQVRERAAFAGLDEMVDTVSLLSAGFPL